MKKLLYLFSAVALLLTSCSSDDDDSSSSGTLLTKIIETYDDGTIENITYTYNGNKIVKISSDLDLRDETIYTYSGDLITKEEYFFDDGAGDTFEEVTEYEYDANPSFFKNSCFSCSNFVFQSMLTQSSDWQKRIIFYVRVARIVTWSTI